MTYWILSLTEDNNLLTGKHGLLRMSSSKRRNLESLSLGDYVTFYISKRSRLAQQGEAKVHEFRGVAFVSGEVLKETDDIIWPTREEEIYSQRRPVVFEDADCSVSAPPVACDLSVVSYPLYWVLPFRGGDVKITEDG